MCHRQLILALLSAAGAMLLAGCGQKGPLVLPPARPAVTAPPAAPASTTPPAAAHSG